MQLKPHQERVVTEQKELAVNPHLYIRPGEECDCGRPAELILNSEKLCSRCRDLQAQYTAYDRKKIIGLRERFDIYGWTRRGLNIHLRREREPEFSALIGWMGTRLTVQAHGRYEFGNELPHAS